ncbi:hypothetical protein Q3V94_11925 [Caloramator sp. CAR-1]|uniref:hypothetical protein n=1 Tax=Caloramator sp. CAR-1 TaxID=3062777 RepID=UPI0026E3CF6A|nr:hypothetical protein [Caloramator sp. CAR-1]MDO6355763.1 hypothetical protein [Caloramator sp. CAR-1]
MYSKKLLILIVLITIIILPTIYIAYKNSFTFNNSRLEPKVKELVTSYYDNLHNKNYGEALSLFDYDASALNKDIENLRNNQDYIVNLPAETNDWVRGVYYNNNEKNYIVESLTEISYMNRKWVATELVFVKQIKGQLKITKIITDDKFCSVRGTKVHLLGR